MAFHSVRHLFAPENNPRPPTSDFHTSEEDESGPLVPSPPERRFGNRLLNGLRDQWNLARNFGIYPRPRPYPLDANAHPIHPELEKICAELLLPLFPDISPSYLARISRRHRHNANAVANHLADSEEAGKPYQRVPKPHEIRQKRDEDGEAGPNEDESQEAERLKRRYGIRNRQPRSVSHQQWTQMRDLLSIDFPIFPLEVLHHVLAAHYHFLLPAYIALYDMICDQRPHLATCLLSRGYLYYGPYAENHLDRTIEASSDLAERELLTELRAARRVITLIEYKRFQETSLRLAEQQNLEQARRTGRMGVCQCCFEELAANRLANCNGEFTHYFCYSCCRRQAENLVGLSKSNLVCMSTEGCQGDFSRGERQKFLDEKLADALDRLEQEASLRCAGLENLESCPMCPFAAECVPAEVDREFRCQNPSCLAVSCRFCRKKTHIPFSCEEALQEEGYSARRVIEEAMSEALIRKCNVCGTPFIKEMGCNKMRCSLSGCRNTQCYVCSQSCDYSHFDDSSRGGMSGNCPLFDSTEKRHQMEIRQAETETRKRMVKANPSVRAEQLEFHMSARVTQDERRRERKDKRVHQLAAQLEHLQGVGAPQQGAPPDEAAGPALEPQLRAGDEEQQHAAPEMSCQDRKGKRVAVAEGQAAV